jgi:hypothetical protein
VPIGAFNGLAKVPVDVFFHFSAEHAVLDA